jgi:hypothetical protein
VNHLQIVLNPGLVITKKMVARVVRSLRVVMYGIRGTI